jgi:hypothetical protein
MTVASRPKTYLDRPSGGGLVDVLDLILDKGLVIDIYVRVSLVGIELLTIDARIVIASVDTYLRFAEAVNRLDLGEAEGVGLPQLMGDMTEGAARHKTKGALEGVKETAGDVIDRVRGLGKNEDEDEEAEDSDADSERPRRHLQSANRKGRER